MDRTPNLGFLTVQQEPAGWIGALLITNHWGRPLEFHITSPVLPSRIQQILYGPTWTAYVCGEVLAKALLEKVTVPLNFVITDIPEVVANEAVTVPLLFLETNPNSETGIPGVCLLTTDSCQLILPQSQTSQEQTIRNLLSTLSALDFAEPFDRLREAIRESRRLGVTARAA